MLREQGRRGTTLASHGASTHMTDPQRPAEPATGTPPSAGGQPPSPGTTAPAAFTPPAEPARPQWAAPPLEATTPSHWIEPVPVPTPASAPTAAEGGRRGSLLGPLLAVALIAAVVSSAGQLLILQAAGLFGRQAKRGHGAAGRPDDRPAR
jgi:hypothetical protein